MWRKLLLAAVLALGVSPAWAQNTQCSDRPAGDSTNACANTRFVGGAVSGGGTITGDTFFGSGRPWCDVRAKGAKGDNSVDDAPAFKSCRVALDALGGGFMYVPGGNYCLKTADANNAAISIVATPITVVGAGINVTNLWTCGADISIGYANVVGAGFVNLSYLANGAPGNPSDPTFGATTPAFKFDTACGLCRMDYVRGFGGLYALDNLGFDTFVSNFSFGNTYGSAIMHEAGNGHRVLHGALDQSWPVVLPNQNTLTISAWQANHAYTGNGAANTNVVSTQGYNIQLVSASCTSGGSAPTLKNYNVAITDGTCSWQLVGATTYYGDHCDGNCAELILHGEVDLNCGGCTANFAMHNLNAGAAPNLVTIDGSSLGQAISAQIFLRDGTGFTFTNSHIATPSGLNGSALLVGPNAFTGGASITGDRFSGAGNCISIGLAPSGTSGYSITGNRFDSCTTAINYFAAAAAVHITAGHNTMNGVTTAFTVPSGSSFYEFTNNDVAGAAISFTASDVNKIIDGNDGGVLSTLSRTVLANGNIGFGTETNPSQNKFIFSQNVTTGLTFSGLTTVGVTSIGADGASTGFNTVTFGFNGFNNFARANNTAASPTATALGDTIGTIGYEGFFTSGGPSWTVAKARIVGISSDNWTSTAQGTFLEFDTTAAGGTTRAQAMRVMAGVIIGTGTTDPGANNLIVGGTITVSGITSDAAHTDTTVCQDTTTHQFYSGSGAAGICLGTSSIRFKHDIVPLQAGLAQILALQPVSYKLNADRGDPNKVLYGFTAEQGQTVLPDLVGLDAEGRPQTFDYVGVVPVLVRAVQQLKADNDNLRFEVEKLKARRR